MKVKDQVKNQKMGEKWEKKGRGESQNILEDDEESRNSRIWAGEEQILIIL
jgi:hypothetical protein